MFVKVDTFAKTYVGISYVNLLDVVYSGFQHSLQLMSILFTKVSK